MLELNLVHLPHEFPERNGSDNLSFFADRFMQALKERLWAIHFHPESLL